VLAVPLIPEFGYEVFRSFVYWKAAWEWLLNRERHWEVT
jgi:hypothetical protein